ncbi:hypothetical protein NPIL_574041 [Nephila pilipes]|uniref:Uncharacterized protein n=1 Tax=Nephila pilipes TaxID=299642 RepID=A0A8X6PT13_NEPPI|nr:hypothetical protein NPIL_574041 [Nephila pilipes]
MGWSDVGRTRRPGGSEEVPSQVNEDSFRCPAGQCKWIRRDGFHLKSYRPVRRKRLCKKLSFRRIFLPVSESGYGLLVSLAGTCRPVQYVYGILRPRAGSRRPLWIGCGDSSLSQKDSVVASS